MKQAAAPGIFHSTLLFPLSSSLQRTPLLILSHPCLKPPPTLTDPPDCDFQTPLHVLFVCAFILPSRPCLKEFCSLFVVSLWRRPPPERERREKEMRGGRQCLSCVCGVWGTLQCLFSVLYDARVEWGIDILFCFPAVRGAAELT